MVCSIAILATLPWLQHRTHRTPLYQPIQATLYALQLTTAILLGYIGQKPVEEPYIVIGQMLTALYFLQYTLLLPIVDSLMLAILRDTTTLATTPQKPPSRE